MIFKHLLDHHQFEDAKVWLNRMIDNNNKLQIFNYEVTFYTGRYYFETGDYRSALDKWQFVVREAGLRYFEFEKKEYLDFYNDTNVLLK